MEVKSVPCTERSVPFELLEEMKTENLGGTGGSGNSCGSNSSGSSSGTNTASKMSTEDMPTTMGKQQQKKSWAELREDVRNLRRKLWTLGFRLPHSFTFRKMAGKTRIYFMASPPNSRDNSIFAVDVPHTMQGVSRFSQQPLVKFPWIQILASGFPGGIPHTKAELLMMERKRMTPTGIADYEFHEPTAKFVFTASSSLYQCVDDVAVTEYPLSPTEIRTPETTGARMNATICPDNSNLIAFVNDGDIWVVNCFSGDEKRLTFARTNDVNIEEDPVSAGLPSYIIQEEFNRFEGFWWQPASRDKSNLSDANVYRLMYEEVDESSVNLVSLLTLPGREPEKYRFPTPGTANATSTLRFVQFELDMRQTIQNIHNFDLMYSIPQIFPWAEYVVRAGWVPEGTHVWTQLLDRQQQRLELIIFPFTLTNINITDNAEIVSGNGDNCTAENGLPTAPVYVVYAERTDVWINVHDILAFLPCDDPKMIMFLWASEESGHRHLYLIKSEMRPAIESSWPTARHPPLYLSPKVHMKCALTSGDWEVMNSAIAVRYNVGLIFLMGLKDSPIERHLYVVSTNQPGEIRRLTTPGHSYTAYFNEECSLVILTYSSVKDPPVCIIHRVHYTDSSIHGVTLEPLSYLAEPPNVDPSFSFPDIYCYQNEYGDDLYAMVYKPFDFDPKKKYPTILNVYGGPEVQLVYNSFRGVGQLWLYLLASQGYCVVSVDSRGSHHRGVQFESHIRRRMGTVELNDQVEVLEWLAKRDQFIDLTRVGIYGWSYGGYLSLMGLIHFPKLFKVCVAGAPVTSWELYDSGYTERYMDLPQNNPVGYKEGSVLTYAHQFPDEVGRLLLVHGMSDENVHFVHTAELLNALVRWGKPYQLQLYPCERHSLRRLDASEHYETVLLSFLQQQLL
ncbi:dipeptidyl peptidase 9 isoform X2 [Folsomia candida]|uniref:Dipeptidyl peptidase 8 n=1 Tax=Folsomia candida TaxID=158441 RepID=A0A226E7U0_FOLCA|nr:dipeptidyl peptidase 9 isoform X2 [Folsomia candida]OXA52726.1 Dipeptidyl peptidase 8 [Folsomia candida]